MKKTASKSPLAKTNRQQVDVQTMFYIEDNLPNLKLIAEGSLDDMPGVRLILLQAMTAADTANAQPDYPHFAV